MDSFLRKADLWCLSTKYKMQNFVESKIKSFMQDENGDTNFISILIVLGIVVALLLIFQGYIKTIMAKVKENVDKFELFSG